MPFRFGHCADCGFLTSVNAQDRVCETCEQLRARKTIAETMEKELMKKFDKMIWLAGSFALVCLFVVAIIMRSQ